MERGGWDAGLFYPFGLLGLGDREAAGRQLNLPNQSLRFGGIRVLAYTDIHKYAPPIALRSTMMVCFRLRLYAPPRITPGCFKRASHFLLEVMVPTIRRTMGWYSKISQKIQKKTDLKFSILTTRNSFSPKRFRFSLHGWLGNVSVHGQVCFFMNSKSLTVVFVLNEVFRIVDYIKALKS